MGDSRLLLCVSDVLSSTSVALPLPFQEFMKLGAFQASASCEGARLVGSPGGGVVCITEGMTSDWDNERLGEPENKECIDELEGCGELFLVGLYSSNESSGACEGVVCTGISTLSTASTSITSVSSAVDGRRTRSASALVSDG